MSDQHTTTTGPEVWVGLTREEAEHLQTVAAASAKPPFSEDAGHALALKIRSALSEQEQPAPSLGRDAERLEEIAIPLLGIGRDADSEFCEDLAKRLGDRGQGEAGDGLPPELARALRDPTIIVAQDREYRLADGRTLAEHLEEWRNAPCDTFSADPLSTQPIPSHLSEEAVRRGDDDRLYNLLALFDRRDGSYIGHLVRAAREGFERSHPDMGEAENRHAWEEFDALWNKADEPAVEREIQQRLASLSASSDTGGAGAGYTEQELVEEASMYLGALAAECRQMAQGGGGELPSDEQIALNAKADAYDDAVEYLRSNFATSPQQSVPDTGEGATDCERCKGEGEISVSHSAYCDCIMTAHCRGKGGKDGKLCRLRRFGSGDEGSPGVAGPPQVKTRCPDCSGSGKKPPDPAGEVLGREGDDRG